MAVPVKNQVRRLREQQGQSQQQFGDALGVSRQTVNSIENGRYDPSLPLAFKIARHFKLTIEEIFRTVGSPRTPCDGCLKKCFWPARAGLW